MHRTGTSAITRVLALLGADLPLELGPPGADNEPGFWEPVEIVRTHERLLAAAGSAWDDVSPIGPEWFATADGLGYEDRLLELLHDNYGTSPLFVLKDPRICRLLPLWLRVFERCGVEPSFVVSVRNPLEVAASLRARDGFSIQKSQLLWLRHMLEAERYSRGHSRSFVSYDRLLFDWTAVIERIAGDLGLTWSSATHASRAEIDRFLSGAHRHHAISDEDVQASGRVLPSVKRLYRLLTAASGEDPAPLFPDNKLILDGMFRELGDTDRTYGPLLAEERIVADERVAELERDSRRELEVLRGELTDRRRDETAGHERIQALTAQVAGLGAEVQALQRSVQDGARRLQESHTESEEQQLRLQAALDASEQALVVSAEEVQALARRGATLEQELADLQSGLADAQAALADAQAEQIEGQARFDDQLAQRDEAAAERERVLSGRLAGREQALELLEARLAERDQAVEAARGQTEQLAGKVAQLEGERDETAAAARTLQVATERAAEVAQDLRGELARRTEALTASRERARALSDEISRRQSDLLDLHAQFEARAQQLEGRQRESAAAERRLAAELAHRNRELAASDASVHKLTAQAVERAADLSLRTNELRAAGHELELARTRLEAGLGVRVHRGARRVAVAVGAPIAALGATSRRWWKVVRWLSRKDTRPFAVAYFGLRGSGALDTEFYLANYRDVARSGTDPLLHYIQYGVRDRYDPNASFSTAAYLDAHPDLLQRGVNPLLHARQSGARANLPALPAGELVAVPLVGPEQEVQAGEPLVPRAPERQADPAAVAARGAGNGAPQPSGSLTVIPRGAIVILACEDNAFRPSELSGHRVWHLDYGPRDGKSGPGEQGKQAEIEALRAKGAGYLVFARRGRTALAQTSELRDHLDAKYRCLVDSDEIALYELTARRLRRRLRRSHRVPGSGGIDVICMPIIDWSYRFQRPQQLMTQFAKRGHRVFYLATTFQRDTRRPAISELADNVWGVRLPGRPEVNIYTDAASDEILDAVMEGLAALRQEARIGPAVVVVDLPFWGPVALESRHRWGWKVIYDCMDEHGGFVAAEEEGGDELRHKIDIQERSLLGASDLVIATSRLLHEKVSSLSRQVLLVPNAADFEHFSSAGPGPLPPSLPRPVIGYYGAIASWFDASLISYAAREHPDWSFVLAGRTTGADLAPLDGLANVHFLGELPYAAVPGLLHQFDVACIPFHLIDLTLATNPVKFYEYMSAGKPVVSVELPELEPYAEYFYSARSPAEFSDRLERALAQDSAELRRRRVQLGRDNTWTDRYHELAQAIRPWYRKAAVIVTSFNNPEYLQQCLDSLRDKTEYPNFEVIVVDNGSDQSLLDVLAARSEHDQNLRLIAQGENVGFARANNIGVEAAADADYVVLLNDDTVVTPGWLGRLIGHLQDDGIGLVGPVSNWAGNEARVDVPYTESLVGLDDFAARRSDEHRGEVFDIPVLAMYCVAARKRFVDQLGRLDERFRIGMFEDDDFAMRVRQAGKRVVCAEDVFVHHWGRASFSRMSEAEYDSLFEENKRVYEEIWNRTWVPHRERQR